MFALATVLIAAICSHPWFCPCFLFQQYVFAVSVLVFVLVLILGFHMICFCHFILVLGSLESLLAERQTHDQKGVSLNPGRKEGQENFLLQS